MVEAALAFLRMNLAAAAAILVIAGLRGVARRGFGAVVAYGLWVLVPLAAAAVLLPARVLTVPIAPPPQTVALAAAPVVQSFAAGPAPAAAFDPVPILIALWALGVVAAAALTIRNQRRFLATAARGEAGPAVVGVIAPRIVTPASFTGSFTTREQRLVLTHERLHIRRQDSRLNGLVVLIQCLCWFNPLIHLGARLLRQDQEMACDEAVITRFPSARAIYARALLKAQLATWPLPLGCYWPSGTGHPLVERLTMINRADFSKARQKLGAALVIGVAMAACATAWAAQPARILVVADAAPAIAAPPVSAQAASQPEPQVPAAPSVADSSAAPEHVCLTNDCMKRGPAPKTLADAMAEGDPTAVRALGGNETQVWQAIEKSWNNWFADRGRPPPPPGPVAAMVAQAFDISDGSTLAFLGPQVGGPQGSSQLAMEKTYPDGTWQRIYLMPDGQTLVGARESAGSTIDPLGAAPQKQP